MRVDSTGEPSATGSGLDAGDAESAQRAIQAHADDIKRRELRNAFDQLEARGTLTPERCRIVTGMATAIVDGILAAPRSALNDASDDEGDIARTAVELFDPDR